LTWHELKEHRGWVASPYAIYRDTQGFSLWIQGKQSGRIGQNIGSLKLAQDMAEMHRSKQSGAEVKS